MYKVINSETAEAISGSCRTFRALLRFSDGGTISGSDVGAVTVEHIMCDDDAISIGGIVSKRAEIKLCSKRKLHKGETFGLMLYMLDRSGTGTEKTEHKMLEMWKHRELSVLTHQQIAFVGSCKETDGCALCGEYIPMGEFVAAKCVNSGKEQTVTAYDRLQFSDKAYTPRINFPAESSEVTADILDMLGIPMSESTSEKQFVCSDGRPFICAGGKPLIASKEYSFTVTLPPTGYTCREVLGHIAAMYGRNGLLDRSGRYTTAFFENMYDIFDENKIDVPEIAESETAVRGMVCVVDPETELVVGTADSAYTVEFECPYMTQERLSEIWETVSRISWYPAQIYERIGDPRRDVGDINYYSSESGRCGIPITSLTFNFDGGLSADISSCGQTDTDEIEEVFILTTDIAQMELLTISELKARTIAEIQISE